MDDEVPVRDRQGPLDNIRCKDAEVGQPVGGFAEFNNQGVAGLLNEIAAEMDVERSDFAHRSPATGCSTSHVLDSPRTNFGTHSIHMVRGQYVHSRKGRVAVMIGAWMRVATRRTRSPGERDHPENAVQSSTTLPLTPSAAIWNPRSHSVAGSTSVMTEEMVLCSHVEEESIAAIAFHVSNISRP